MDWDKKARRWANCFLAPVPLPKEAGELRDNGIKINLAAESERAGFEMGARWQRHQLRTPEAIERMAIHILSDDAELTPEEAAEDWGQMYENPKRRYRERATQHINALLGED